jgi:hypothetical protein
MVYWTIELLSSINPTSGEPTYIEVLKLSYDPNLKKEDELWVNIQFNKKYHLKTKVLEVQKTAYFKDRELERLGEDAVKNGALVNRIIVEAEDRDAILEISSFLQR